MLEDLFVGADSPIKGQVATFADLPATAELGDLFVVKQTTGVIGINRKIKGLYRWDGAAWGSVDGLEANKVIYNNADSSLTSGTVKAAIDELDTKRQDASNLTSGTIPEDRLPAIDADNTTISNLEVDNLKEGTLDTDLTAASANDNTLASAKAIKAYVDANATPTNVFHAYTSNSQTPDTTATEYYAVFGDTTVTNTDIYSYSTPSSSTNTGIRLLKAGKYKVSYTLNWVNVSYANRVNFFTRIMKHSSAITPTMTEIAATRSYAYARDDGFAKYATTTCVTVIDVAANEYIKCQTNVSKNDNTFDDTFNGIDYHQDSSIVIEFLGNI